LNTYLLTTVITANIIGVLMVSLGRPLYANLIWVITNPLLVYHNLCIGQRGQATMFTIYMILAVFGVINLT
jgi:hypothetical protein